MKCSKPPGTEICRRRGTVSPTGLTAWGIPAGRNIKLPGPVSHRAPRAGSCGSWTSTTSILRVSMPLSWVEARSSASPSECSCSPGMPRSPTATPVRLIWPRPCGKRTLLWRPWDDLGLFTAKTSSRTCRWPRPPLGERSRESCSSRRPSWAPGVFGNAQAAVDRTSTPGRRWRPAWWCSRSSRRNPQASDGSSAQPGAQLAPAGRLVDGQLGAGRLEPRTGTRKA